MCRSNNDLNLCEACTGSSFAECIKCYDGYYMNENYQCLPCSDNCDKCNSDKECL